MRVLHVINDLDTGGAQSLVVELARGMRGIAEVHIAVLGTTGVFEDRLHCVGAKVHFLRLPRQSWRLDLLVHRLRSLIRSLEPDLIHSHLLQSDLGVALARGSVPAIHTIHTSGFSSDDSARSRALAAVSGLLAPRFQASVACSRATLLYMHRHLYRHATTMLIPNGVVISKSWVPPLPKGSLLMLARWHPMKGHVALFSALKQLGDMGAQLPDLVLAGANMSSDNGDLVNLIAGLGLRDSVSLVGEVKDVSILIRDCTALVIPSTYGEGLPMAGLEAIAAGRPVIVTRVGSSPELTVEPWQTVAPGDVTGLANALATIVSLDAHLLRSLSEKSRQLAESTFNVESTVSAYRRIYEGVVVR